jgi:hypothetical protein
MMVTLIWKPQQWCAHAQQCRARAAPARGGPPPPGTNIFGPPRDPALWEPVGITVDEDTLPHVLTFTACDYKDACRDDGETSALEAPECSKGVPL